MLQRTSKLYHTKKDKELALISDPTLTPLCEKYGKSPAQVFDFSLSEEDMEVMKSMAKNRRYFSFTSYKG
ncbi:hypothetical protein AVEN_180247-1, partial [Araneus ventricosus]